MMSVFDHPISSHDASNQLFSLRQGSLSAANYSVEFRTLAAELGAAPSEPPDLSSVPPEYHDLAEVFSKQRALSLPPHRPYDCAIEILPGAPLPTSRLYNLSAPERESMETYITDSLNSVHVLVQLDPDRQFVVEVDASDIGVGAVLSQRAAGDNKLHPCAFFSKKLSPAEQNYDVGNRELLAVKLALEEWRHWLEGTDAPFTVLQWSHSSRFACHPGSSRTLSLLQHHFWRPTMAADTRPWDSFRHRVRGPQFTSKVWKEFCRALGATVSLSSGYHPQSNGQTERANQDLETALHCICARDPASWSTHLAWEIAIPSVQLNLRRIRRIWRETKAALLRTQDQNRRLADRRRTPAPEYKPGQKLKPVSTSTLCPPAIAPPSPRLIDGHPAFTVSRILDVRRRGRGYNILLTGRDTAPRRGVGFPGGSSWTPLFSLTSIGHIQTNLIAVLAVQSRALLPPCLPVDLPATSSPVLSLCTAIVLQWTSRHDTFIHALTGDFPYHVRILGLRITPPPCTYFCTFLNIKDCLLHC
ncbi:uncharacterized protein LOC115586588 [Sparus aurata]|uniref:uncharacterized protein LOC115586588 n=1 Tax=Sparus aurata TaxID=8175 RepID=UPI0011C1BAAA|nr:uncharacterized protein LOC115586588 [Sparus aurata]